MRWVDWTPNPFPQEVEGNHTTRTLNSQHQDLPRRTTSSLTHLTHCTSNEVDHHPQKCSLFKKFVSIQTSSALTLSTNSFRKKKTIFSIPKFTGKALELAIISSMILKSKGWFVEMFHLMIISCTSKTNASQILKPQRHTLEFFIIPRRLIQTTYLSQLPELT